MLLGALVVVIVARMALLKINPATTPDATSPQPISTTPTAPAAPSPPSLTPAEPDTPANPDTPVLPLDAKQVDALLSPGGGAPLKGEPADLTPPPGAHRVLGYERTEDGAVEQMAVYVVEDSTLEVIRDYYEHAAAEAGYTHRPRPDEEGLGELWVKEANVLLIRPRRVGDQLRVSLILRYTITPRPSRAPTN